MVDVRLDFVKKYYHYCPETGNFTRLIASSNNSKVGEMAGYIDNGYVKISLLGKQYKAHRLAFLYMTGRLPLNIDHINGNRSDNRWCNLRECTLRQNQQNTLRYKTNKTGIKGLSIKEGNYYAQINVKGKRMTKYFSFSKYNSKELAFKEAKEWIENMRILHHKEFANHG